MNRTAKVLCVVWAVGVGRWALGSPVHLSSHSSSLFPSNKSEPYLWRNVTIVAGGFVNGLLFHPAQKDLIYAKTDMGGAYRWDVRQKRWTPLTDWAGQTDWNLRGIESIGLDPSDPRRVYIAAGTYTFPGVGNGSILRSIDQGRTFQRTELPLKMGGNEEGRSAGERLAVDPNQHSILYFGSRHDGLWRSIDYGATWNKADRFPITGRTPNGVGIAFVVFNPADGVKGRPTPTIYVGVSSPEASLYQSTDAGVTWSEVPGAPKGLLAHQGRLSADHRTLYLTYGNQPGPNGMTGGAVWKFDTRSHAWADISPIPGGGGGGFAGLTVGGPQNPQLVMVSTLDHWSPSDDVFRSADGGRTWKAYAARSVRDPSLSPYLKWGATTPKFGWWIGALALDPFDTNHVMYGTGATIWESHDAGAAERDEPTHWAVGAPGLEEVAVIDLISPPAGAHLLSGVGDIGGFRHDDFQVSPPQGMFLNPELDNIDSLDFAESAPSLVVRVGRGGSAHIYGGYSTDGGATWTPFISEPEGSRGSGSVAISADGGTILWTPFRAQAGYTRDHGATWTACQGFPQRARVISDRVNSNRFYAFDTTTGTLFASTDGGGHFVALATGLPAHDNNARLRAVPGAEGDLWLTTGGGLYHSTNGGASFTKLTTSEKADAVGFGKAAPGTSYVALYLIGKVAGVEGFFRSDDAGATWIRINDDRHQYGLVGPIIGDPRIYGRVYLGTNGRGILYADPAKSLQTAGR